MNIDSYIFKEGKVLLMKLTDESNNKLDALESNEETTELNDQKMSDVSGGFNDLIIPPVYYTQCPKCRSKSYNQKKNRCSRCGYALPPKPGK